MERNQLMYEGLHKLYLCQIILLVMICGSFVALIPVFGLAYAIAIAAVAAAVAALVLNIMGLVKLRRVDDRYTIALITMAVSMLLSIISDVGILDIPEGTVDLLSSILSLVGMWFIVKTTNEYLEEMGRSDVAARGNRVLILNIVLGVVGVVLGGVLLQLPVLTPVLLILIALAALVVSIIGAVLYVRYLGAARNAFQI